MKVFLSGKMNRELGAWRTALLGERYNPNGKGLIPRWIIKSEGFVYDHDKTPSWPTVIPEAVLNLYDYTGPFLTEFMSAAESECSGVFHGTEMSGWHGIPDQEGRAEIVARCKNGIRNADFVFAYINSPDCFGTLVEIGYAKALGKYVHLLIDYSVEWDRDDYWFASEFADETVEPMRMTPEECVKYNQVSVPESESIKDHFLKGVATWAARISIGQRSPVGQAPEIMSSLNNIQQWTSDPRTRAEASRLLRKVDGRA